MARTNESAVEIDRNQRFIESICSIGRQLNPHWGNPSLTESLRNVSNEEAALMYKELSEMWITGRSETSLNSNLKPKNYSVDGLSHDTLLGDTLSTTTLPDDALTGNTLPDDALTGNTLPDDALTGNTLPDETLTGNTLPDDTLTGNTLPNDALPEDTLPKDALHGDTLPDDVLPGVSLSGDALPGDTLPDDALPGDTFPDNTLSDDILSDDALPGDTLPLDMLQYDKLLDDILLDTSFNDKKKISSSSGVQTRTRAKMNKTVYKQNLDKCSNFPFRVKTSRTFGRHFVAARPIKPGEIIVIEHPIVRAPVILSNDFKKEVSSCVNCCQEVKNNICGVCGFFVCRENCQVNHSLGEECKVLSGLGLANEQQYIHNMERRNYKNMIKTLPLQDQKESLEAISKVYLSFIEHEKERVLKSYPILAVLRTLNLIQKSPKLRTMILSLQGENNPLTKRYKHNKVHIVDPLIKLGVPFDSAFIHRIADIWDINAFQVPTRGITIQTIYLMISYFTHNCKPNCESHCVKNGSMVVRAVEYIPEDTILTLSYCHFFWPTCARRRFLSSTKKFICYCERCMDYSENGTYLGFTICEDCGKLGVRCEFGEDGEISIVLCAFCYYKANIPKHSRIEAEASKICRRRILSLADYKQAVNDLTSKYPKRYHGAHYIVLQLRLALLQNTSRKSLKEFSDEEIQAMEYIGRKTQKNSHILPRMSFQKALITQQWIRYRRELFKRDGKSVEADDKKWQYMKLFGEDARIVLKWVQDTI